MYKFLSRPQKKTSAWRPLSGAALLIFSAMSVVAPAQIQHSDARTFSSGLKIKVERNAPPFAALEDAFMDHLDESSTAGVEKTEALGSSTLPTEKVVARIVKGSDEPDSRTIAIRSVSRDDVLQTLFLPMMQSMQNADAAAPADAIDSAVSVPHRHDRAAANFETNSSPTTGFHRVTVMPTAAASGVAAQVPTVSAQSMAPTQVASDHAQLSTQPIASAEALTTSLSRQINGTIELTEGLALTSPADQIVVYHEVEDAPEGAEGTVWLREGRYRIQLDNLSGTLVAELHSAQGDLLGRGELDLADLPLQSSKQYRINDIALKIVPVAMGLQGQTVSGNAFNGQRVAVPNTTIESAALQETVTADAKGVFTDDRISRGSTALVQATRPGYLATIATAAANQLNTLVLLPKAYLKSIAKIVQVLRPLTEINSRSAIVWGHVTMNGSPIAGAQVKLLSADDSVQPIYLNEMMIPDGQLTSTSSNGLFMFIPVTEAPHAVQAMVGGHLSEAVLFPTRRQAVSSVDVEMTLSKRLTLKSFDAFDSSHAVPAVGMKVGSTRAVSIGNDGTGFMRYAPGSSLLMMDVDGQAPYTPERFTVSRDKTYMYLPMVKTEWLEALRGGFSAHVGNATVVGFVQSHSTYHVLIDEGRAEAETIVYFDAQGQPTHSGMGEPGGGFVIFNIAEGYRQITVTYDDSQRMTTSVVLADSHVVSIVNHSTH